ncbi:MAG: WD40 repeat domain-containing protein, partial [Pirellulales bacterium]
MNRLPRFWLAFAIAVVWSAPAVVRAAEKPAARQDGKKVRLAWFPKFSPDGKWLLTAQGSWVEKEGGEVRVWHAETGEPKVAVYTDRGVRTVAWAPSGKFFVSGDYGGAIDFYDAATGQRTAEMNVPKNVEVLLVSPDETKLVAAAGDGSVRVYELPSRKEIHVWKQLHQGGIWGMALSPDGKRLCTAGQDDVAHVLDM